MATLYTNMSQVSFSSKLTMVDGLVDIDGMLMPMDFIEYLPVNVEFEYYCDYGTYVENGTFTLTNNVTELKFPMSKLEYSERTNMVELSVNVEDEDAIISVYPVQLIDIIGDGDLDLLPTIEVINGKAMVPEFGIWVISIDIKGKATTSKQFETNGDDVEIDVPPGIDTEGDSGQNKCHLQINVSPITALVEVKIDNEWRTSSNNYFENIDAGSYNIRVSNSGYIIHERTVAVTSGLNNVSVVLIKEDSDGSEIIVRPSGSLPPLSYSEVYINNINKFKYIRVIPLVNSESGYWNGYDSNIRMWNNKDSLAQYDEKLVDVNMDVGLIKFKSDAGIWIIEAIPIDNIKYYKSSTYVDLHNMNYKYLDIELVEREKMYNLKCNISNHIECDKFHSYAISYESADMMLNSGILATAKIDEEINTVVPSGTYTIIATLYDHDGMEVKVPITPENFTPYKDMDISFRYNRHIKVKFTYSHGVGVGHISPSSDNVSNLLTSSIYAEYGYDEDIISANVSPIEPFNISNSDEHSIYIQDNGGNVRLLFNLMHANGQPIGSVYINETNVRDGSIIDIPEVSHDQNKYDYMYAYPHTNNILRYTASEYVDNNTSYYGRIGRVYSRGANSPFIPPGGVTESNIHSYTIDYNMTDAKYKISSLITPYQRSYGAGYIDRHNVLVHDTITPIFTNTINVIINTNIPDSDIIIHDINTGLYRAISKAESYYGHSPIYKGTGIFNDRIPDNCIYSATIYRNGFAIKTFSFSASGKDIVIDKEMDLLDDWGNNIPISNSTINPNTSNIEFDLTEGSSIDITSIEPMYPGITVSGDTIYNVPPGISYRVKLVYHPPKSKIVNNPVSLTFGGISLNDLHIVENKRTVISIHRETGIHAIKSKVSVDTSGSPNLSNKKIIIYHNGKRESLNLTQLPKIVDIYGYSEDMYLELYDGDTLIDKNMFFLSHEHSDIIIKVPSKKMVPITVKPIIGSNSRSFIAWKEDDPYIAPFHGMQNLNRYTKYDKIDIGSTDIVRNLYASVGDTISYKLFIDGYFPYEGTIRVSDNTTIDLNTITLPRIGNAFRYYGIISPNIEYMSVEHGSINPKITEAPILTSFGSLGYVSANVKYSIPMFISNNNDFDIYKYSLDHMNTTTLSTFDGYVRMFHDNRPSTTNSLFVVYTTTGLTATNGKYPFIPTSGGLISNQISIYNSNIKLSGGIIGMPQQISHGTHAYLYPGRYKFFNNTSYYQTSIYGRGDSTNNSGDIVVYSGGDILIKEGPNYIDSNYIKGNVRAEHNGYMIKKKMLVASLGEVNQAQFDDSKFLGSMDAWVYSFDERSGEYTSRDFYPTKVVGTKIAYRDSTPIIIRPTGRTRDTVVIADVSDYLEGGKNFKTKFINISTTSSKNSDMYFNFTRYSSDSIYPVVLTPNATNPTIDNIGIGQIFTLYKNDDWLSDRKYGFQITGNHHNLPIYYKVPHGDIVSIIPGDDKNTVIDGVTYKINSNIHFESPISYGMSYSKEALDKTIVTIYNNRSVVVSGVFPMKIPIRMICSATVRGYSYGSPDIIIDGYILLSENMVSLRNNGIYAYIFSFDDVVIESKRVLSDAKKSLVFDPDGRAQSGEFHMDILGLPHNESTLGEIRDDWWYGHKDRFTRVNFEEEYVLREPYQDRDYLTDIAFVIRYTDKVTNISYFLGSEVDAISSSSGSRYDLNPMYTTRSLLWQYYRDTSTNIGPIKTSNVSFANITDDILEIEFMIKFTGYGGVSAYSLTDFTATHKIPYGVYQFYVYYEGRPDYTFIRFINEENTLISLTDIPEMPSTNIKTGGYRFEIVPYDPHDNIYWTVEVFGDYRFNSKRSTAPIGSYKYVARRYGCKPIHGNLEVVEGQTTIIELDFEEDGIPEFGTVRFNTTPRDTNVYIENKDGTYVRIRSDRMSIYLPFGEHRYMAKKEYYLDYSDTVIIDKRDVSVDISMKVRPTPEYLISFNTINPKHGVIVRVSIDGGEWFETNEVSVKKGRVVDWTASADGFKTKSEAFWVTKDLSIDINLSRGTGYLRLDTSPVPRNMRLEIEMPGFYDGELFWRDVTSSFVITYEIPLDTYRYRIVWRDGYNGAETHEEIAGTFDFFVYGYKFVPPVPNRLYGYINVSVSSNILDYELTLRDLYSRSEIPITTGVTEIPTKDRYSITCTPKGKYSEYLHISEIFDLQVAGSTKYFDFVFDNDKLFKYNIEIYVFPSNIPKYTVEEYIDRKWVILPINGSTSFHYTSRKPKGSRTRVRVSANGYKTQDVYITYDGNRISEQQRYNFYMEEIMEGGYLYPLYPGDFGTNSNEGVASMLVVPSNKNPEFYEKYGHIRFDGTRFGRLPATVYPRNPNINPSYQFDKFYPIMLRIYQSNKSGGTLGNYPIVIDDNRRESFVVSSSPSETYKVRYARVGLKGGHLRLPLWELSNSLYTVTLRIISHQTDSVLGKKYSRVESEKSYILAHGNERGLRLSSNNMTQNVAYSVRVIITRHSGVPMYMGETLPANIYDEKLSNNENILMFSTWRDNGLWRINFNGYNAINGTIYFFLENAGNVIAERIGSPISKRWLEWYHGGWYVIDGRQYLVRDRNPGATSIKVRYLYIEDGYEPYLAAMDVPTARVPSTSHFPDPISNHYLMITNDMMQASLLGYQRNKINDSVTVKFGIDDGYDSIEKYMNYEILEITPSGLNGNSSPLKSHPVLGQDVTGLTLQFERNTLLSVKMTGLINITINVNLDKNTTYVNAYDQYRDDMVNSSGEHSLFGSRVNKTANNIRVKFNISKYNPNRPSVPDRNLNLSEFDEIIISASVNGHIRSIDQTHKYFIYRETPRNDNIIYLQQTPCIMTYRITLRKKGYNTILLPITMGRPERSVSDEPIEISLPTLHPVTE